MFTYLIVRHTGLGDGEIKPMVVYSFLTGIIAGKLIDNYLLRDEDKGTKE